VSVFKFFSVIERRRTDSARLQMQGQVGLMHRLAALALLVVTVSSRHHHAKKHHRRGRSLSTKFSAWDELPEFESRLGRIQEALDSAILYEEASDSLGYDKFQDANRRRRREAKVVGSVLATGVHHDARKTKMKTYPRVSSEADWEHDLVTDDDDKLSKTVEAYVKDPSVKGLDTAPNLQSTDDFSDDFPIDNEGDEAEEAFFQREQDAEEDAVREAKDAAREAQQDVEAKIKAVEKASDKTEKAQKKVGGWQQKYSNATAALRKAKEDVKRGHANETRLKGLQKNIREKIKKADKKILELNLKLYNKRMHCKKQQTAVAKLNSSELKKKANLHANTSKMRQLKKSAEFADNIVRLSEKALKDAEEMVAKLEAALDKSHAAGRYILPAISFSLVAAVLGLGTA